jgi:hypothetical protein
MRSIKFDQLGRKAPVAPPSAIAPPATLAAGSLSFRAEDVKRDTEAEALKAAAAEANRDAPVGAGSPKP